MRRTSLTPVEDCNASTWLYAKKATTHLLKQNALQGDAEDLPFATNSFDRYLSAGSIEYWPEPQRGIKEAYRQP